MGLNRVEIDLGPGAIRYRVRYWQWALYAIGLCGALGLVGVALLLSVDVRDYFTRHPRSLIPGVSIEQHVVIAWGMALFWGFIWPWLLISMHKRPLRGLVTRLIAEVDAGAVSAPLAPR